MKGDISKLPVWAQQEIENRDRKIASLQHHVEELSTQHPDTNVKIDTLLHLPDVGLPKNSYIDFYLSSTQKKYQSTVSVHIDSKDSSRLVLMGNAFQGRLSIQPSSSNVVFVTFTED
jgi:hypothetical protein